MINILLVICVIVLVCWIFLVHKKKSLDWISSPHSSGKYGKASPGERLPDVIKEFGLPSVYDPTSGGVAIWDKETLRSRGSCFDRIEIRDEQIPHGKPANHVDFLYTWYPLDVPDNKICDIIQFSTSISYDPLKKMIRARCHFMGANIVTIWLAKKMVDDNLSLKQAQEMYGPIIMSTVKDSDNYDSKAYDRIMKKLCP